MIVGLHSNSGGESFTFEPCAALSFEVVVKITLVSNSWAGDYDLDDLNSTIVTAQLPLSKAALQKLRTSIDNWLATDVCNAEQLDGLHRLVDPEYGVFNIIFAKRSDLISAPAKPTITLHFKFGRLTGEFAFVTDQSCLREFSNGLSRLAEPFTG